jgi:hypothetical protein
MQVSGIHVEMGGKREDIGRRRGHSGGGGGDSFRGREGLREENYSIQGFPPSSTVTGRKERSGGEESGRKRTGGNRGKEGSEEQTFLPTSCGVF